MRHCQNKVSGEVCEYFIFGAGYRPEWFKQTKYIDVGTVFVRDTKGVIHEFADHDDFFECCEIIYPIRESTGDNVSHKSICVIEEGSGNKISVSTDGEMYIDPKASFKFSVGMACYKDDKRGVPFEFFIYDSRSKWYPDWFDINKMSFPLPDNEDFVINNNGVGLFDKGSFCDIFEVVEPSLLVPFDVDASFVGDTLDYVGRKCKLKGGGIFLYDFFVYQRDNIPRWFDASKVKSSDEIRLQSNNMAYVINSTSTTKYTVLNSIDFNSSYVEVKSASAKYASIERNEGAACKVGGCKKSSAARFCRCRNDHSVVHEFFVYGIDDIPEWANQRVNKTILDKVKQGYHVVMRCDTGIVFVMSKEDFDKNMEIVSKLVLTDMYGKETVNYIGKVSEEEMESVSVNYLCTDDGYTVKIDAAKYAMERMVDSLTGDISEKPEKIVVRDGGGSVDAGTCSDEKISSASEGRICFQKSNGFVFNFFVYGVDNYPSWYDEGNTFHQYLKEGDWVVRDFRCNGMVFTNYSCPNMVSGVFEEIQNPELYERSVIVSRGQFDYKMKEYSLPGDIEAATYWFQKVMNAEVFKYLVLKNINEKGMVDIVELHKSETNGRN